MDTERRGVDAMLGERGADEGGYAEEPRSFLLSRLAGLRPLAPESIVELLSDCVLSFDPKLVGRKKDASLRLVELSLVTEGIVARADERSSYQLLCRGHTLATAKRMRQTSQSVEKYRP